MGRPGSGQHHNKGRRGGGGSAGKPTPKWQQQARTDRGEPWFDGKTGKPTSNAGLASRLMGRKAPDRGSPRQYAKKWRGIEGKLVQKTTGYAIASNKYSSQTAQDKLAKYNAILSRVRGKLRPPSAKANPRWRVKPSY